MATSLRDLRRKIKSITSTQKITSAMQLVAASKMQRAIKKVTDSRSYADLATELVTVIAPTVNPTSQPLFETRPVQRLLVLLITTNRGLTGPLNTQLIRELVRWQTDHHRAGRSVSLVAVGAKGRNYLLRFAKNHLLADFPGPDAVPTFADVTPIAQLLIDEFLADKTDAVYLAYNHFRSTLRQEPRIVPYLPFQEVSSVQTSAHDILFEPSKDQLLQALIPRVLRVHLYQTLLETYASEQAARMIAMKNATDNAGDLVDDLTLTANSVRQTAITSELLDIAAGAAALES